MKPWHQFKQDNPTGFYTKEYSDHTFIVYQHPRSGHLNGYVLLNEDEVVEDAMNIDCHGGITLEGDLAEIIPVTSGRWLGFDCAHYGDMTPFHDEQLAAHGFDFGISSEEVWRDPDFVESQCRFIIDQLENRDI